MPSTDKLSDAFQTIPSQSSLPALLSGSTPKYSCFVLNTFLLEFLDYRIYSHSFKDFNPDDSQPLMTNSYSEFQIKTPTECIFLEVSYQLKLKKFKDQTHHHPFLNYLLLKWQLAFLKSPKAGYLGVILIPPSPLPMCLIISTSLFSLFSKTLIFNHLVWESGHLTLSFGLNSCKLISLTWNLASSNLPDNLSLILLILINHLKIFWIMFNLPWLSSISSFHFSIHALHISCICNVMISQAYMALVTMH